jgi:dicarboxylate transporter 10
LNIVPDGTPLHTAASFAAGTFATTAVTPIDVIKSRIQNAKGADAKLGIAGMISKSVKADGAMVFFRGWTPAFLRLQPQTTLWVCEKTALLNNELTLPSLSSRLFLFYERE